ncbi:alpha-2-HS-glycoprotein-like [Cololabis saira]|uniref:alpha-2-HS-glycoprotein-like n=1 Tax=Cololabis saira TaxID=129043 RepID=UPI002AD31214|nr:alpha-2-HS-glycoprotein-like [Cololabis saira]
MNLLGFTVALGLLAGIRAQINVLRPPCDSPEAEDAALAAQDYLNAQHNHGYKYAWNRIEDIKINTMPDGNHTFVLELDLLETDCHVLDPTPVANCTVRPKRLTAVEGDCDVVLKRVSGVFTVTAFKCKTEESTEDLCLGCPTLLPLNHTGGLDFVQASLTALNNLNENVTYTVLEVGRMSSTVVSGGAMYRAEYVVIEANCINDTCVPLNDSMAARGICIAEGQQNATVDCKMFSTLMPLMDANSTAAAEPAFPPVVATHKHGVRHHKLTAFHNPLLSTLLSAESVEVVSVVSNLTDIAPGSLSASDASDSAEMPITLQKRDLSAAIVEEVGQAGPMSPVPVCPGRVRFF